MSLIKKLKSSVLLRDSAIYTIAELINKAIPFLLLPILTAYLSTADYGIVSNYQMLCNILMLIVGVSTHTAITVNYFRIEIEEIKHYVTSVLYILLGSSVALFLLFLLLGRFVETAIEVNYEWVIIAVIYSTAQFLNTLVVKIYILRREPIRVAIFQIVRTLIDVGLTLYLIMMLDMTWEGRLIGLTVSGIIYSFVSFYILYKLGLLVKSLNLKYIKDALKIGIPLIPHQLSGWLKNGADRFFITSLVSLQANGIYSLAFQLGLVLLILFQSFNQAFAPYLYKNLVKATIEDKIKIVKITYVFVIGLVICVLLGVVLGPIVLHYIIDEKFYEALDIIPLVFIAFGFKGLYFMVVNYLIFEKATALLAKITFSISLLHLLLSYLLIDMIGIIGACYALIFSEFITFLIIFYTSNKTYPMPWLYFLNKK